MRREPQRIGPQERLLLLKSLAIAEGLRPEGLVPLAQHAVERRFVAGATVIQKGEFLPALFLVVDGRLQIEQSDRPAAPIGRGEITGALEVMANARSAATIRAAADTLLLEIPADTLFDVYEDHFDIFMAVLRNVAETLLARDAALTGLDTGDLDGAEPARDPDDLVQRLLWLRSNSLFKRSRLGSLVRIAVELETVTTAPGIRLWTRGDRASWSVFLVRGKVTCTSDSSRRVIEKPGLYLGALETLAQSPRSFDADVSEAMVGLRLNGERFTDMLEDDFGLAKDLLAELAGWLLRAGDARPVTAASETGSTRIIS